MEDVEKVSNSQSIKIKGWSSIGLRFLDYLASNLHSHGIPRLPSTPPFVKMCFSSSFSVFSPSEIAYGSRNNVAAQTSHHGRDRLPITAVTRHWLVNSSLDRLPSAIISSFGLQFRSGRYHRLRIRTLYPTDTCNQGKDSKKQVKRTEMVRSRGNEHEMH